MVPAAMKVGVRKLSCWNRGGHGGHSVQLFTAVLGCEGFPAPVLI